MKISNMNRKHEILGFWVQKSQNPSWEHSKETIKETTWKRTRDTLSDQHRTWWI